MPLSGDKLFSLAKGFRGRAKNCLSIARERVEKALQYQYRDRRRKKREMRSLWVQQISAGARQYGLTYNLLIRGLAVANVNINRKILSHLALYEPLSFRALSKIAVQNVGHPSMPPVSARRQEELGVLALSPPQ